MIANIADLSSDPARALLVGVGGILAGLAAFVFYEYAKVLRSGYQGAKARHVVRISASYLLFVLIAIITFYENAGTGFHIRLVIAPIASYLGISALVTILRDLRARR